jgi:hypothetical protein
VYQAPSKKGSPWKTLALILGGLASIATILGLTFGDDNACRRSHVMCSGKFNGTPN